MATATSAPQADAIIEPTVIAATVPAEQQQASPATEMLQSAAPVAPFLQQPVISNNQPSAEPVLLNTITPNKADKVPAQQETVVVTVEKQTSQQQGGPTTKTGMQASQSHTKFDRRNATSFLVFGGGGTHHMKNNKLN